VEVVQIEEHVDRRVPPPDAYLTVGFGRFDVALVDLDIRREGAQHLSCIGGLREDIDIQVARAAWLAGAVGERDCTTERMWVTGRVEGIVHRE
jgi:hypothetical protein